MDEPRAITLQLHQKAKVEVSSHETELFTELSEYFWVFYYSWLVDICGCALGDSETIFKSDWFISSTTLEFIF